MSPPGVTAPPPLVWTEPFAVRAYEVGPDERATPRTLADYAQEAAGNHARALGVETFALAGGPAAWVLHRLRLRIDRFPRWREAVAVETWPSDRDGLRAFRDVVMTGADGATVARGESTWFVIDLARRRPVRLPPAVVALARPDRPRALGAAPPPTDEEGTFEGEGRRFAVRRADLDRNAHANNACYLDWALEALPDAVYDGRALVGFDLVFRAEAVAGDTVVSHAAPAGLDTWTHRLTRATDGALLAVAHTDWR